MGNTLKTRLRALECGRTSGGLRCGVVTFGRHETPDEAMERAKAEGMAGSVLLVPAMMSPQEWEEMMAQGASNKSS